MLSDGSLFIDGKIVRGPEWWQRRPLWRCRRDGRKSGRVRRARQAFRDRTIVRLRRAGLKLREIRDYLSARAIARITVQMVSYVCRREDSNEPSKHRSCGRLSDSAGCSEEPKVPPISQKRITLRLPTDLMEKVQETAYDRHCTVSEVVRVACETYVRDRPFQSGTESQAARPQGTE